LLSTGQELLIDEVSSDTIIYIQEIKEGGALGDIFGYEIGIFPNEVIFDINPDTLFLGENNNLVQITDLTENAVSWRWDLDNGLFSSIQNPQNIYNEEGVFDISLEVTNAFGCIDSLTRQLTVLRRREAPIIGELPQICPGETVNIFASNTSLINVYADQNLEDLLFSGENYITSALFESQTFFITNSTNNIESQAARVDVIVNRLIPIINVAPNLQNLDENTVVIGVDEPSLYNSFSWMVNGEFVSNEAMFSYLPSANENINVTLSAVSSLGCDANGTQLIEPIISEAPFFPNQLVCSGSNVLISPSNGELFAYFSEENDQQAAHKGRDLLIENITNDTSIFIRGIDGLLESESVQVDILVEDFSIELSASSLELVIDDGVAQRVDFGAEGAGITSYLWFIDDLLIETIAAPTFFFESPGEFNVKLIATNENNCRAEDEVQINVSLPAVVTSTANTIAEFLISPNPTSGLIFFPNDMKFVGIYTISGKLLNVIPSQENSLDLSKYRDGVYFLKVLTRNNTFQVGKIVLRK